MASSGFSLNDTLNLGEVIAYVTAVMGMLGDQVSTRLSLTRALVYESNPHTALLMSLNLWLPFDVAALMFSVGLPAVFIRRCKVGGKWAVLAFPLIVGVVRLLSAVWNLGLFFSV